MAISEASRSQEEIHDDKFGSRCSSKQRDNFNDSEMINDDDPLN